MDAVTKSMPNQPLICLVEDDHAVRWALGMSLRSSGWRCHPFASAEEFLGAPQIEACDCLVTDLNMPGMNGAELLETIRLRDPHLPVVAMTAAPGSSLVKRALQCGISALLIKPFQDDVLLAAIATALALVG